jgi:hypothetical protein
MTSAPRPELMHAPHDMHRGREATVAHEADGNGDSSPGMLGQLREMLKS